MSENCDLEVRSSDGWQPINLYLKPTESGQAATVTITTDEPPVCECEGHAWTELDLEGAARLRDALTRWIDSQPEEARGA